MSTDSNAPVVEYRRLGNSGLRVSVPIIGAMSFGSDKWASWVVNEEKAMPLLKAAWDRGVTTIDTANTYSAGVSEQIIGKFLKENNIPRHRVIILTKCFFLATEDPGLPTADLATSRDYVYSRGLSRGAIFNQVEASLRRLDTPYIDLLQIHRFDPDTPPEETMKALHDVVQSGKVRYIGASSMRTYQFQEYQHVAEKNGWTKFVSMQNEYSLLYREEEREMIPYCNKTGVGLIPWGPVHGGDLTHPFSEETARGNESKKARLSDNDKQIIERVEEIAKKKGWSMAQVALAWVDKRVSSPIVGISSPERLESNILGSKTLDEEDEKYLEELYVPKVVRGHS